MLVRGVAQLHHDPAVGSSTRERKLTCVGLEIPAKDEEESTVVGDMATPWQVVNLRPCSLDMPQNSDGDNEIWEKGACRLIIRNAQPPFLFQTFSSRLKRWQIYCNAAPHVDSNEREVENFGKDVTLSPTHGSPSSIIWPTSFSIESRALSVKDAP